MFRENENKGQELRDLVTNDNEEQPIRHSSWRHRRIYSENFLGHQTVFLYTDFREK